jgi:hypothetical protein
MPREDDLAAPLGEGWKGLPLLSPPHSADRTHRGASVHCVVAAASIYYLLSIHYSLIKYKHEEDSSPQERR